MDKESKQMIGSLAVDRPDSRSTSYRIVSVTFNQPDESMQHTFLRLDTKYGIEK
jgi:hypothetical protein